MPAVGNRLKESHGSTYAPGGCPGACAALGRVGQRPALAYLSNRRNGTQHGPTVCERGVFIAMGSPLRSSNHCMLRVWAIDGGIISRLSYAVVRSETCDTVFVTLRPDSMFYVLHVDGVGEYTMRRQDGARCLFVFTSEKTVSDFVELMERPEHKDFTAISFTLHQMIGLLTDMLPRVQMIAIDPPANLSFLPLQSRILSPHFARMANSGINGMTSGVHDNFSGILPPA